MTKDQSRMDSSPHLDKQRATASPVAPTAHTPGPWSYYSDKLRPAFPVRVHEIHGADGVAVVKWGGFDGVDYPRKQIAANARLIAAAPDLLAACVALDEFQRVYASNTYDSAPGNDHYAGMLLSVVERARAAIANAEGSLIPPGGERR